MIEWFCYSALAWLMGFLLDLCFGDPHWLPHPVRLIGHMVSLSERFLRRVLPDTPIGQRVGGVLQTLLVSLSSFGVSLVILWFCWWVHPLLYLGIQTIFCYQILAVKSLKVESGRVYERLREKDLPGARQAVSRIVGRDTAHLTGSEIAKAAVETVAENTCDGVIAPLFFLVLGGAPLGFFYKAVNTMDSMVGYRNERYQYFGAAAAKTDDVLNWLPARISSWLMILSAKPLGFDARQAKNIYLRDRHNHASPNSAHTEAACAGALHIQLGGDAYYFGELHHKPTIGNPDQPITAEHICNTHRLLYGTAVAAVLGFGGISAGILLPLLFCV